MIVKEPLEEPMIFHGIGGCPKCCGTLMVADSEISLMELNKDGIPTDNVETTIRCEAICTNCGHRMPMLRWKYGYIPDDKNILKYKMMELRMEIDERKKNLKSKSKKEENPLSYKGD